MTRFAFQAVVLIMRSIVGNRSPNQTIFIGWNRNASLSIVDGVIAICTSFATFSGLEVNTVFYSDRDNAFFGSFKQKVILFASLTVSLFLQVSVASRNDRLAFTSILLAEIVCVSTFFTLIDLVSIFVLGTI